MLAILSLYTSLMDINGKNCFTHPTCCLAIIFIHFELISSSHRYRFERMKSSQKWLENKKSLNWNSLRSASHITSFITSTTMMRLWSSRWKRIITSIIACILRHFSLSKYWSLTSSSGEPDRLGLRYEFLLLVGMQCLIEARCWVTCWEEAAGRLKQVGLLIVRQTVVRWPLIGQTANFWPLCALGESMALIHWEK